MRKIVLIIISVAIFMVAPLVQAAEISKTAENPTVLLQQITELGETNAAALAPMLKLVVVYRSAGQYNEAVKWAETALKTCRKVFGENHSVTNASKTSLAVDYRNVGRYTDALALDEEVLGWRISNVGEKHPDTLSSYNNIATDYRRMGQYKDAEQIDQKLLAFRVEVLGETHVDTLTTMNNLAADYRKTGKNESALELDQKVFAAQSKTAGENNELTLTSLNNLAGDYDALGRYTEALDLHRKAVEISTRLFGERHPSTLVTLTNLALDYSRMGRYSETLPLEEKILKIRMEVLGSKNVDTLISANNLAGDYYTQERYEEAAAKMQMLVDGVEELRKSGDLSPENRQSLFAQWIPSYKNFSLISFAQKNNEKAFYLSEMTKARTLLELTANRLADSSNILSTEEAQTVTEYQGRLAQLNEKITNSFGYLDDRVKVESEKREVLKGYEQFRQQMMDKYPKYRELSDVTLIDSVAGAKLLPPNAVFISYMVTNDNKALAFIIDPAKGLTGYSLGEIYKLNEIAQVYHDLLACRDVNHLTSTGKYLWRSPEGVFTLTASLARPDETSIAVKDNKGFSEAVTSMAKTLADKLILPIWPEIKGKRQWVISGDGALSLIPFETLVIEDKLAVMEHDISYSQSLSMLALLAARGQEQSQINANDSKALFAMGAAYYQGTSKYGDSNIRLRGNGLQDLKSSEPEMDALARLFPVAQTGIYKRDDSTEAKLLELNHSHDLAKYQYLLFSAHGYFDDKEPKLNSIVLGQKNLAPGTDGFVTVSKWPGYTLNSKLVYLSACETGRGQFVPGEGILGLTYALVVAGNKNTIATLWKTLDDDSAVKFTSSFFAKLLSGASQVEALSETKREFINEGKYNRSIYWAPFVLYGI